MEINEACINELALAAIRETIGDAYEYADNVKSASLSLMEISGIIRMTDVILRELAAKKDLDFHSSTDL